MAIAIQSVDTPRFSSIHSYNISTNVPASMLDSCSLTNLLNKYTPHKFHNLKRLQDTINTYRDRVQMLCCEGEAEGIELHSPSEEDFYSFVKSAPFSGRASLVLIDNGNLRAVWRNDDGSHVGIQFRGGQTVSYVIFKRRSSASGISRVAGTDTLDGVKSQIRAFGLEPLLNA